MIVLLIFVKKKSKSFRIQEIIDIMHLCVELSSFSKLVDIKEVYTNKPAKNTMTISPVRVIKRKRIFFIILCMFSKAAEQTDILVLHLYILLYCVKKKIVHLRFIVNQAKNKIYLVNLTIFNKKNSID